MRANSVEVGTPGSSVIFVDYFEYSEVIHRLALFLVPAQLTTHNRRYAGSGGGDEYVTPQSKCSP